MITVIYNRPHKTKKEGVWLIGWSKTQFEKAKTNIFHYGTELEAQNKIDGCPCKKYLKKD